MLAKHLCLTTLVSASLLAPGLVLAQNLTPSDTVFVQMNSNNAGQNNGHLQVQYQVNGQNLNTSTESLIKFDLSALSAAHVIPSDIQSANLILFVDGGGGPAGNVTVCELGGAWSSSSVTGMSIPACLVPAITVPFTVTSSQLKNGAFISVPVTAIVQSWLMPNAANNGIELEADAPTGGANPENVQFDSLANNGQGFAPMLEVVTNTGVTTISTAPGLLVNGGSGPASGADTLAVDTTVIATNSSVDSAIGNAIGLFASSLSSVFLSLSGGAVSGSIEAKAINSDTTLQILSRDVLKADANFNTASGFGALNPNTTGSRNTAHGFGSMAKNTSGNDNTAHGWNVMTNVTTGSANSAVGSGAMSSEASGNNNVANGWQALTNHTSGDDNTAIGTQAGMNLQTGTKNVMMGKKSGQNLASTESWNIMINNDGVAGDNNTIRLGKDKDTDPDPTDANDMQTNTYIAGIKGTKQSTNTNAKHVLIDTTTGQLGIDETSGPTAVNSVSASTGLMNTGTTGSPVLAVDTTVIARQTDVTAAVNTAQGFANTAQMNAQNASLSLANGGTVAAPVTVTARVEGETVDADTTLQIQKKDVLKSDANNNVAVGIGSLATGAGAGKDNTGAGYQSLSNLTSGSQNSACGKGALMNETTGSGNTATGWNVLMNQNGGSNNTAIGTGAGGAYTGTESNNIVIGHLGVQGESNTIHIGTDGTGAGTQQKTSIAGVWNRVANTDAVPVVIDSTGTLGTTASSRRYKEDIHDMGAASDALLRLRPVTFRYKKPNSDGSKPVQYGLIAEEVAEVYPNLVVRGNDGQVETVQYYKLDAMLLNEVQKLSRARAEDQAQITTLRAQLAEQLKQAQQQQAALSQLVKQVQSIQVTVAAHRSAHRHVRAARATVRKRTKSAAKHPSGELIASAGGRAAGD